MLPIKIFFTISVLVIMFMLGYNKGYNKGFNWATEQERAICEKEVKYAQESNSCSYTKKK